MNKARFALISLPLLLASCSLPKQEGNFACNSIKNGAMTTILYSYSKNRGTMNTVSISVRGSTESVINAYSSASEINEVIRWNMKNGSLIQSFALDKQKMRLKFTDYDGTENTFSCKWI